jgi:hypothetical protein
MSQKILNPQKLNKNRFHQLVKRMIGHSLQLKLHKLSRQYLINRNQHQPPLISTKKVLCSKAAARTLLQKDQELLPLNSNNNQLLKFLK